MNGITDKYIISGVKAIISAFRLGMIVYQPGWDESFFAFLTEQFWMGQGPFLAGLWLHQWQDYHVSFVTGFRT